MRIFCDHCGAGAFADMEGLRAHWTFTVGCPIHGRYGLDQLTAGGYFRISLSEPYRRHVNAA